MKTGDFDEAAAELLQGTDAAGPTDVERLVERVLGVGAVRRVPATVLPGDAALARVAGTWRVFLTSGISVERQRFALAHELGHAIGLSDEADANRFAGALLLPKATFLRAIEQLGELPPALAQPFRTSAVCAALRIGEATAEPRAVIVANEVRKRGRAFAWPPDDDLRRVAAGAAYPGLRKAVRFGSVRSALVQPA